MSPTILLLPGMSLNQTAYPQFPFPTICPDFNSKPPPPRPADEVTMDVYVDVLDDWLASRPEWNSARRIVVAHSFGGMLAMRWLLRHDCLGQARIDGLVLLASTAGPMFDVLRPVAVRLANYRARIPVSAIMRAWSLPVVMKTMKRMLAGNVTEPVDFQTVRPVTDFRIGVAGWRNTDWRAMQSYRMALDGFDIRDQLEEITVPTEVLHGSRDSLFPTTVARDLVARLPDARLTVVPGGLHSIGLSHPKEALDAVTRLSDRLFRHS